MLLLVNDLTRGELKFTEVSSCIKTLTELRFNLIFGFSADNSTVSLNKTVLSAGEIGINVLFFVGMFIVIELLFSISFEYQLSLSRVTTIL